MSWSKNKTPLVALVFLSFAVIFHWDMIPHIQQEVLAGDLGGGYFSWLFWVWKNAFLGKGSFFHTNLVMYPTGIPLFFHAPISEIAAITL